MKIVFATFGSLGDLHPYIAVARELKRRGHGPMIATFAEYRDAVEGAGIGFAAMRPDMGRFGDKTAMMQRLIEPRRGPELMVRELFMPHLAESYEDLERACAGADLLVTHPLSFAGPLLAEKHGLRWVSTALSPLTMFSAVDPPLLPSAEWMQWVRKLGAAPYRLVFRVPRAIVRRWERPLREFRARLGLPPTDAIAQLEGQFSPRLHLALFSRLLAAPQSDWPASTVVCGFPRYDGAAPARDLPAALDEFLAAGEPPVVFALGSSAVMVAGNFWRHAIEAAGKLGCRAILLAGEAGAAGPMPPSVRIFDYLPYSAVFPRAAAIVHSGGIGTLAQALAAGRPQLITPVAFDQPDNARRAAGLGVARTLPFGKVTAAGLEREIANVMGDESCAKRAREAAAVVCGEDGARGAADALARAAR
jgi:UDP:flavonoid glycosyltransferase YjiC (YdhE family)